MIKMAIDSKLTNYKGKNLVQKIKNKGITYIAPILLLVGCSKYNQSYINDHYQINLTHDGRQGEIISNEKPKFLGIHWMERLMMLLEQTRNCTYTMKVTSLMRHQRDHHPTLQVFLQLQMHHPFSR